MKESFRDVQFQEQILEIFVRILLLQALLNLLNLNFLLGAFFGFYNFCYDHKLILIIYLRPTFIKTLSFEFNSSKYSRLIFVTATNILRKFLFLSEAVISIEYDPNRNANISLISYEENISKWKITIKFLEPTEITFNSLHCRTVT